MITYLRFFDTDKSTQSSTSQLQDEINTALAGITKLSAEALYQKIDSKEKLTIIDIRDEDIFSNEHLPNSTNIPLTKLADAANVLEKGNLYVLLGDDSSLITVASGAKVLSGSGFHNLAYLEGGFSSWKNKYQPTISVGNPNSFTDQSKVNYITSEKLKELLSKEKGITIIDVRKSTEYNDGHIRGARNICLTDIENKKSEIPLTKKIILYDDSGIGAFQAAVRLFDMGFFNTHVLSDGLDAWKAKKFEVVK
jgi:rhodanese-related sulfurtransferase